VTQNTGEQPGATQSPASRVEVHRRLPLDIEMIRWDGTKAANAALLAWCGESVQDVSAGNAPNWLPPYERTLTDEPQENHARGYAATVWNTETWSWVDVPCGYYVARGANGELITISPAEHATAYAPPLPDEMPDDTPLEIVSMGLRGEVIAEPGRHGPWVRPTIIVGDVHFTFAFPERNAWMLLRAFPDMLRKMIAVARQQRIGLHVVSGPLDEVVAAANPQIPPTTHVNGSR